MEHWNDSVMKHSVVLLLGLGGLLIVVCYCDSDPNEVDATLLQLCSSQLKLLQLYTDIQQLHSAADGEGCTDNVSTHKHR